MADSCSGNTAAGSGQTKHGGLNLTNLPDVVLEHLFKMLRVTDRGALASTCSRLSAIMHRPSVWTDVYVYLVQSSRNHNQYLRICTLSNVDEIMIRKYGQYFQRVKVITDCAYVDRNALDEMHNLCKRRVLKTLLLYMEGYILMAVKDPPKITMGAKPLPGVADLIHTLSPDTRVVIKVPSDLDDNKGSVLKFYSCTKSEKFRSLVKRLELPETQASDKVLVETDARLSPAPTAMLVSQFPALQELQLSMGNMSDALLLELADTSGRRCPLQSLDLRHVEWKYNAGTSDFPQLSSAAWKKLASASPSLTVTGLVVVRCLPSLSNVIKPETPLVKLKVNCDSGCKEVLELFELCKQHSSTLQNLDLCLHVEDERVEEGLKNMVKACPRLRHLTCDMDIHSQLIMDLADDCRQWRTFRFHVSRIITHTEEEQNARSSNCHCRKQIGLDVVTDFVRRKTGFSLWR